MSKIKRMFKTNLCTLEKVSKDDKNNISMTKSQIKAVNYDNIVKKYGKYRALEHNLKSNDALYDKSGNYDFDENGDYIFIEFKNGFINETEEIFKIKEKIYDSAVSFLDIVEKDLNFLKVNVSYILVYNEGKNTSKEKISSHIFGKAKDRKVKFGIKKFEKYLFKNVSTYTEKEFEQNFVKKYEKN